MSKEDSTKIIHYNREGEEIDPPSEDYYDEGSGTLLDCVLKPFNVAEAVELANGVLTQTLHGPVPTETAAKLATAVTILADRLAMSKEEYKGPYIYHKLEAGEDPDVRFRIPTEDEKRKYGGIWHFDTYKDRNTWFKEKPPGEGAIWIPEIKPNEPSSELLELSRKFKSPWGQKSCL